jgi:hypothetical protein
MNGRAARTLRRDVRRTVGEDAISIIDAQTNAINHQILPNQNALLARVADLEALVHALERHCAWVHQGFVPKDLSLFQRLRWFVCGR